MNLTNKRIQTPSHPHKHNHYCLKLTYNLSSRQNQQQQQQHTKQSKTAHEIFLNLIKKP